MLLCCDISKTTTLICLCKQKLVYILTTTSDKICTDKNWFGSDGFPTSLTPMRISPLLFMIERSSICQMKIEGNELLPLNKCQIAQRARKIRKSHLKTIVESEYIYFDVQFSICTELVSGGTCGWYRTGFSWQSCLFVC